MKYIVMVLLLITTQSFAAPHPATSSSFLIGMNSGRFISQYGFVLNAANTHWIHQRTPRDIKNIETVYAAPKTNNGVQPSLTVRVDELTSNSTMKDYVSKWVNDYPRLGFDILASKKVKVGPYLAQMIDFVHNDTQKQLRQVIFVKDQKAVIFTCRDYKQTFLETLKSCNEIVRTFHWTI
ncbi:MAG: hypothetical protein KDD34_04955 [Bdellovibrionales bacterium]|nr:hypothetical protein [Bdellovibrionales bacterium]